MEPASGRLSTADWASALAEQLLPPGRDAEPVVLQCDGAAVSAAGAVLGVAPADSAGVLGATVRAAGGLVGAARRASTFRRKPCPRPVPEHLAALAVLILAAARMGDDDQPAQAYYSHLRPILGPPDTTSHPPYLGFAELCDRGFKTLADWLARDEQGRRGALALPEDPWPRWVGVPISQVALRAADRRHLGVFFAQRADELDAGWDPAGTLARHPARHHLTRPAQALLDDARLRPLMSTALVAARAAWDGRATDICGRTLIGARLGAAFDPADGGLALSLVADGLDEPAVGVGPDGAAVEVPAAPEAFDIPLAWLAHATREPGEIELPDRRCIHALPGPLMLFDVGPLGLEEVACAGAEPVWALTSHPEVRGGDPVECGLPDGWRLLADVDPEDLPEDARPLPAASPRGRLRLSGGLPLGSGGWLSEAPPAVRGPAGLDCPLTADGEPLGRLLGGRALSLGRLAGRDGPIRLEAGDLSCDLLLVRRGLREGYGRLRWQLGDPRSTVRGPRPGPAEPGPPTISGALIDGDEASLEVAPAGPWCRLQGVVWALRAVGVRELVRGPAGEKWELAVGWRPGSRWRLPLDTVWACQPRRRLAQLVDPSKEVVPDGPDVDDTLSACADWRVVGGRGAEEAWRRLAAGPEASHA